MLLFGRLLLLRVKVDVPWHFSPPAFPQPMTLIYFAFSLIRLASDSVSYVVQGIHWILFSKWNTADWHYFES